MAQQLPRRASTAVFDLDGTLSDPSEGIVRSFRHALAAHGLPAVADADIRAEIGPPLDAAFRKLAPGIDEGAITGLVATYRERYADTGYAENTLYPEIPPLLERLRAARVPLGVCTSKREDFARRILALFGLDHLFRFVDGGDVGVSKASQLSHLLSAGAIDGDAVMIGDRAVDIEAAGANGLAAVGVLWGFGGIEELAGASPAAIVDTPDGLGDLLLASAH